jgi:integrase
MKTKTTRWFVFTSERPREHSESQLTRDAFAKILRAAADPAGLDCRLCHPHALRHAAGALDGQWSGQRISVAGRDGAQGSTQRAFYVQGVAGLIKGLWG